MMNNSNISCANCGSTEFTRRGYNRARTKVRLVCKSCGKNVYVDCNENGEIINSNVTEERVVTREEIMATATPANQPVTVTTTRVEEVIDDKLQVFGESGENINFIGTLESLMNIVSANDMLLEPVAGLRNAYRITSKKNHDKG